MSELFINEPCPLLPEVQRVWRASDVTRFGDERSPTFYEASLCYAQSQWRCGFPAQAILQINRSFACTLSKQQMTWPLAYDAIAWLITHRREGQFVGNPTRHFQHLATRMVEPNKELRSWRAWACWHLSRALLPQDVFPGDAVQIRKEGVVEPTREQIRDALTRLSPADDVERWEAAYPLPFAPMTSTAVEWLKASREDLPVIEMLARKIWPAVYPGIISQEQISYMLEWMYSQTQLEADLERGVEFYLLLQGEVTCGFVGLEVSERVLTLHKLYLLPENIGNGLGGTCLQRVAEMARARGCRSVILRVNKHNSKAIRAYLRQGFVFESELVADIGGGFVMDDHVMRKDV
ncbi:MAG: GNAT family N-acetyltransferase [Verrucomicrobiaceae bacterium]|nr:GNAT family N-acetyltransferase [Verrucomicrobiaceae bacterium]